MEMEDIDDAKGENFTKAIIKLVERSHHEAQLGTSGNQENDIFAWTLYKD